MRISFVAVVAMQLLTSSSAAQIPAFPGAEGAGALATGGRPNAARGGLVYHVTTLAADPAGTIPGSLRYGMRNENFISIADDWPFPFYNIDVAESFEITPRIIVFDVGGTINIGEVDITPMNFTIAGQTAPGGITLYGGEFNPGHRLQWNGGSKPKTNNLVIRNLSIRTHDSAEKDGLWFSATNSIADHLSMSWYTDEGLSITDGARDVTVQHSIIGPGWNNPDGDGSQLEGSTPMADISVHHNLYIHNDARVPRVGEKEGPGVEVDFRNNVIYNWDDSKAGYSVSSEPSFTNFVNNYYIGGADNDNNDVIFSSGSALTRIYQSGNLLDRNFNGVADGQDLGWTVFSGTETQQAMPYSVPHPVTQTPQEALDTIFNYGGANWWDRHFLDERSINQLQTYGQGSVSETGRVLTSIDAADVAAVTGAPLQTRPAGWDSDNDGMPNHWELERGLDPNLADWDGDDDTDGYVNLEEYINELAEWPAPDEIVFNHGTSRYAEINNWSITRPSPGEAPTTTHWQPSRFDVAVINSGTVEMDAPGQHAGTIRLGSNPGDNATLNITSGWLEVEDETVGPGDGSVIIGADPTATAAVNLSGGRLIAKSITKGDGGALNFTGGVLSADTVGFDLVNHGGTIAPGNSPGMTHVMGDLTINSGSLQIELGGTAAGEFDRLVIDGAANLGGSLEVSLFDGFEPTVGQFFQFVSTGGGIFFEFDSVNLPALATGNSLRLVYGEALVGLEVVAGLAGDFDGDGDVDGADFLVWQRDSSVGNVADWRTNFGSSIANPGTAVPEPYSLLLAVYMLTSSTLGRRCKSASPCHPSVEH